MLDWLRGGFESGVVYLRLATYSKVQMIVTSTISWREYCATKAATLNYNRIQPNINRPN